MDNFNYKKIMGLLACPACQGDLKLSEYAVVCINCQKKYHFRDGVLSFLGNEKGIWKNFYKQRIENAPHEAWEVGYATEKNFNHIQNAIKRIMDSPSGTKILDIGCGNGIMSSLLVDNNVVVGIDFVFEMLKKAGQNGLIPIHADGMNVPIKQESFDIVMAIEVIPHVEDIKNFIPLLCKCVKRGGVLLITGPNAYSIQRKMNRKIQRVIYPEKFTEPLPVWHDPLEIVSLINNYDMNVDLWYTYFPLTIYVKEKSSIPRRHYWASNFFMRAKRQ